MHSLLFITLHKYRIFINPQNHTSMPLEKEIIYA